MPYIKQEDRDKFKVVLSQLETDFPENSGELNYLISSIIKICLTNSNKSYKIYNDIIGALECAKLELYRKEIAPYEEIKIEENGDI